MAFTKEDYTSLVATKLKIQAIRDAQITINKELSNLGACVTSLQAYLAAIGKAGGVVSQDLIDEITTIGTLFNNGRNSIMNNHKVFLTGDDGIE